VHQVGDKKNHDTVVCRISYFTASQAGPTDLQNIIYDLTSVVTKEEIFSLKKNNPFTLYSTST
jgi:hypothetical protein